MFTGLVETRGTVETLRRQGDGATIVVRAPFAVELERGESVAVNGACLTVVRAGPRRFEVEAVAQTLAMTTIGRLTAGAPVNLERALRLGDRMGGHVVTGHIDGIATVTSVAPTSNGRVVSFELPPALVRHVVPRGSIALDGVSLTVAGIEGTLLRVALIPETLGATIAGSYRSGSRANVETDIMAKHQEKLSSGARDGAPTNGGERESDGRESGLTAERLKELGFLE